VLRRLRGRRRVAPDQTPTVDALEALLFRHDPLGLDLGDNLDEYRPEAETLALRRDEVRSVSDARRVTHEEFVRWFGADTAGPPDRYAGIAREVWELWRPEGG
jgi:hypothetical protein